MLNFSRGVRYTSDVLKYVLTFLGLAAFCAPPLAYVYIHTPAVRDDKTHIRYMTWGNPTQVATDKAVLERFMELNPDIVVEAITAPGGPYHQKLQVMLASNTAPDVFKMDLYWLPKYFPYGYFMPLNELDAKDPDFSFDDFYAQTKEELSYNGKIYGLNTLFGGKMMYYNKTAFQKAGLPDPWEQQQRGEWTFDAMLHAAKTLTVQGDRRIERFGIRLDQGDLWWIIWGFGGDAIDKQHNVYLDKPETIAGLKFFHDLMHEHRVMPQPGEAAGGVLSFESGTIAMASGYAGETPRLRKDIKVFDWDFVPVPRGPKGQYSLVKGNGLIINAKTKEVEASWRLVKFMNSREGELAYCGPQLRRAAPTRISVSKDPEFLKHDGRPPFNTGAYEVLYATGRELPVTAKWQSWQTVWNEYIERMSMSKTNPDYRPPEVAGPEMARRVREILAQERPL